MRRIDKAKEWIRENIPMVAAIYENKYVGMLYDRFASLPGNQQRHVVMGGIGLVVAAIVSYLLISYISLWSFSNQQSQYREMIQLLKEYQKQQANQSGEIGFLERNARLAASGQLKTHLVNQAKRASISQRMVQIDELPEKPSNADGEGEVKVMQAKVKLERVNLRQLQDFLRNVEFGEYNLGVSSLKVVNDSKIRGYMNVDIGVVAYLFSSEQGT